MPPEPPCAAPPPDDPDLHRPIVPTGTPNAKESQS